MSICLRLSVQDWATCNDYLNWLHHYLPCIFYLDFFSQFVCWTIGREIDDFSDKHTHINAYVQIENMSLTWIRRLSTRFHWTRVKMTKTYVKRKRKQFIVSKWFLSTVLYWYLSNNIFNHLVEELFEEDSCKATCWVVYGKVQE